MEEPHPFRQSARKFARTRRRAMRKAETMLWWALRDHQVDGHAIRRQMPIGPFVADFAWPARRLIIEVDGRTHVERSAEDAGRDAWFRRQGWRVLRFSDDQVIGGLPLVIEAIARALRAP